MKVMTMECDVQQKEPSGWEKKENERCNAKDKACLLGSDGRQCAKCKRN